MANITQEEIGDRVRKVWAKNKKLKNKPPKEVSSVASTLFRSLPWTRGAAAAVAAFKPTEALAGESESLAQSLAALERRKKAGSRGAPGARKSSPSPAATLKKGGGKIKKNYSKGGGVRSANY